MEENEKRDINMVAMEVIMNAGDGRDKIDEALAAMAEGKLDEVDKLLEEAEASDRQGTQRPDRGHSESGQR